MGHAGLAWVDVCQCPEVVRLALTDAPAVLGWQTWRAIEVRHGLGVIIHSLQAAALDSPTPSGIASPGCLRKGLDPVDPGVGPRGPELEGRKGRTSAPHDHDRSSSQG